MINYLLLLIISSAPRDNVFFENGLKNKMKICDQTMRQQCDDSAVLIGVYLTENYNMFSRKEGFVLQMYDSLGRPAICINR